MKPEIETEAVRCLLCTSEKYSFFFKDKFREYHCCNVCSLLFVPTEFHVSPESEKERYEEHNNDPNDIRYRQFLERIAPPIRARFKVGKKGLDFGCGPTPLLAEILREDGFEMEVYDPFYAPDKSILEGKFDFVVSTEVFEHLKNPLREFKRLFRMLNDGGVLAIMTRLYNDSTDFKTWHYKNDRTHICFYSIETFDWLSKHLDVDYTQIEHDIFVFEGKRGRELNETPLLF